MDRNPKSRDTLSVSVAPVLRRAGVRHPMQRSVQLDELRVGDAYVGSGRPIDLDLTLEASGNAVVAEGSVDTLMDCECRRCLEPFEQPLHTEIREIFEPKPVEGETYPLVADHIDLVPLVREALLLALPLAPLCRADCPGPAPERFPTRVTAEQPEAVESQSGEDPAPRDPRWAVLDQLKADP